jgi:hypothetical protein
MSSAASIALATGFNSILGTSGEALTLKRASGATVSVTGLVNETEKDEGDRRGISSSMAVIEISTDITTPPAIGETFVNAAGDSYSIANQPTRIAGYRWQCICRKSRTP